LAQVMAAANDNADIVVQVGDMHPGYSVVKKYGVDPNRIYAVPGNHDTDWDSQLGWSRQWIHSLDNVVLVGLDNSKDIFDDEAYQLIQDVLKERLTENVILFVHKPLSTIVLSDGSESQHIMGEGALPNKDADKMKDILNGEDVLCCHGHYHGWSLMMTHYATCLIEGRGGAAPELGYTIITVQKDGLVLHQVTL
jgi:predicted phosphodiesterase